jgi:predicted membrane protein (TIGR00267 family)
VDDLVILPAESAATAAAASLRASLQRRAAGLVRDVILGGQDGLVNVLGLVLGMAVATGDGRLVTTAGLAALLAESIAMSGVAFTATGAERSLGRTTRERLARDRSARRLARRRALATRLREEGSEVVETVLREVEAEAAAWLDEVRRDRESLAPVRETRPIEAALVVGCSTALGSSVPLLPFVFLPVPNAAVVALGLGAVVLAAAGSVRADLTGGGRLRAAIEMVAIGLVSAFAGFLIGHVLRTPAG